MGTVHFCNYTSFEEDIYFKNVCTNGSNTTFVECIKDIDEISATLSNFLGGWYIVICSFGIFGNLATIICIPFAARKKILGFDKSFNNSGIFICNLALIDLCHCFFSMILNGYALLADEWPFGTFWCDFSSYVRGFAFYGGTLGLSLIGISRCLDFTIKTKWENWADEIIHPILLIVCSWLPGIILMIPSLTNFSVGWHCGVGTCDFNYSNELMILWVDVFLIFSMLVMIFCYLVIWSKARKSKETIEQLNSLETRRKSLLEMALEIRNKKMTRTILFLILMHICCNLPVVVYNIYYTIQLEIAEEQSIIAVLPFIHSSAFYYVMNILYGSQSAINFFIYAFTNEHYKTAYIEFWNHLVCKEKRWQEHYEASIKEKDPKSYWKKARIHFDLIFAFKESLHGR